ncbi:Nucleosome assembly protein (NAP) [Penicillium italicum]|uniref:Nucleosome assembly protein (NAP) n=1 Tax=Penicillium italicum TaxID=40296 RepID=A0A0A2L2X9_PENIT|nr:Nucleosome assembly protein (NAP) [Penicillium italicum]
MSNDQSLLDRVEMPSIPEAAMKKIAILEEQFSRAEVEQLRHSIKLTAPLIQKRSEIINIPDVQAEFWMRVFASAPPEIDEYILSRDAQVLGESLKNMNVERFELDAQCNGEPRSLRFTFEFKTGEENPFFTNEKLVKEFYWRQKVSKNAAGKTRTWEGLVSEPVRINWKKDMDLTKGMLDAACDLAEAEKKKGGDRRKLPEFAALVKKVEEAEAEADAEDDEDEDPSPVGMSFFGFFGYRGRDVSAAQSKEAAKEIEARWAKIQKGEDIEDAGDSDSEDEEDESEGLEEIEIFPYGDSLAVSIAEDIWPDALSYYVQSFQMGEELEDMDLDMEEMDGDDSDEESESRPRKKARN